MNVNDFIYCLNSVNKYNFSIYSVGNYTVFDIGSVPVSINSVFFDNVEFFVIDFRFDCCYFLNSGFDKVGCIFVDKINVLVL